MATVATPTTAESLLASPRQGRCELIRGEVVAMSPSSGEHGRIAQNIGYALASHVKAGRTGVVFAAETGFILARNPDTVRAPDAAFVTSARAEKIPSTGFVPFAPDLAVEVLSPSDRADDVAQKVRDWLDAGAKAVWIIDPKSKTIIAYRCDRSARLLVSGDQISDDNLLPGFSASVDTVFE